MTWEVLFADLTPYPTIVIPIQADGTVRHAFCVVDNLIFDSLTPFALKLKRESVLWTFNLKVGIGYTLDMVVAHFQCHNTS